MKYNLFIIYKMWLLNSNIQTKLLQYLNKKIIMGIEIYKNEIIRISTNNSILV